MSTTYGTIPTSVPGPDGGGGGGGEPLAFLSRAKERGREALATRRPWREMVHSLALPLNLADAYQRIRTNLSYFAMNYAIAVLAVVLVSLLWLPWSLIVFGVMMVAWLALYFLRDEPLVVAGRTVSDKTVLMALSVVTVVALLFTGATWNIISSVLLGLVLVVVHAAVRTDDLWSEEEGLGPRGGAGGAGGWYMPASSSS